MIVYTDTAYGITPDQLPGFFVDWPNPPSSETHLRLLAGSDHVVLAIDDKTRRVVGFVTAISDGVLSAYIPLLEVLPDYQDQGIGTGLMQHMLDRLRGLYMVDLFCDPELQSFYDRLDMHPAQGMSLRHYDRQSGEA